MAMLPQKQLFRWEEIENLGDLERLELVLKSLPDEALMRSLESHRGRGRNDYPVRALWNSILAGIVFQHSSIESLRRELLRNGQLRWLCGFDLTQGVAAVPPAHGYSRFLKVLLGYLDLIEAIFDELVKQLCHALPGFGTHLAMDGKALPTHARPRKGLSQLPADGRRDTDAVANGQRHATPLLGECPHSLTYATLRENSAGPRISPSPSRNGVGDPGRALRDLDQPRHLRMEQCSSKQQREPGQTPASLYAFRNLPKRRAHPLREPSRPINEGLSPLF